ncbi:unnamed protein product, partial [Polarella glacialis]
DQLQMLQHLQASKDRELVYLRVGMTIRRLEEDQSIEHKQVTARIGRHVLGVKNLMEKILRAQGVSARPDMYSDAPGSINLLSESFIHL